MKKILILTANPKNSSQLRLAEEVREIQAGLERAKRRDEFEIVERWAVRTDDLRRSLLDIEPNIVHFSGHGTGHDGLMLENEVGEAQLVSAGSLARLFGLFKPQVDCVVLNACYSTVQAEAIAQEIPTVIGMSQAIGDRAAIEFAVGFYDALGAGRSYGDAFKFGCSAIDLEGIPEAATPQLLQHAPTAQAMAPSPPQPLIQSLMQPLMPLMPAGDRAVPAPLAAGQAQLFISYKRDVQPDEAVALQLSEALQQQHQVFIDQMMLVGTPWAEQIEAKLKQSQFLIVLLSAYSVTSEMVEAEISMAHRLAKEHEGYPMILPVRLQYREPFQYPLSAFLDRLNWAFWGGEEDTPRLIQDLLRAIAGHHLPQSQADLGGLPPSRGTAESAGAVPRPLPVAQPVIRAAALELPEGTMDAESQFYVERAGDAIALMTIQRQGVTLTIKGPRQMGKSSLLMRVMDAAIKAEKQTNNVGAAMGSW
jgi:hypothetical protein